MKSNFFYVSEEKLIEYLKKYGRGADSKDYEFAVSIYAKHYWEAALKQKLCIAFEQNDKKHNYPKRFTPNLEQLKDILRNHNKENTPVDFSLVPVTEDDNFIGHAYPFQTKKYVPKSLDEPISRFAEFINKKVSEYRDDNLGVIFLPQISTIKINDLKEKLNINENSVRAIYCFTYSDVPTFNLLWASKKALSE